MTDRKVYIPMTLVEAEEYITEKATEEVNFGAEGWRTADVMIYAETLRLHARIDEIENQAQEMMSPEKMMEMATGFLGGGLTP